MDSISSGNTDIEIRICSRILQVLLDGWHNDMSKPKFDIELLYAVTHVLRNVESESVFVSQIEKFREVIKATRRFYEPEKVVAKAIAANTIAAAANSIAKSPFERNEIVPNLRKSIDLIKAIYVEIHGENEKGRGARMTYLLAEAANQFIAEANGSIYHHHTELNIADDLINAALENIEMFDGKVDEATLTKTKDKKKLVKEVLIQMTTGRVTGNFHENIFQFQFRKVVLEITSLISELCGVKSPPILKRLKNLKI